MCRCASATAAVVALVQQLIGSYHPPEHTWILHDPPHKAHNATAMQSTLKQAPCATTAATAAAILIARPHIDNAFGRTFSSKIGHDDTAIVPVDEDEDHDDDEGEKEDEDEEEDEDGGDETQHARDVEDLFAGGNRLSTRKFGRQRRRLVGGFFGLSH